MTARIRPAAVVFALALLGVGAWYTIQSQAQQADKEEKPKPLLEEFMREKLDASNEILEGLCTEDYALIRKGSAKFLELSQAERWRISNDAIYRQHSLDFQRVAKKLNEEAKAENLDGAALAWLECTMNCIDCHRFVRAMLIAAE